MAVLAIGNILGKKSKSEKVKTVQYDGMKFGKDEVAKVREIFEIPEHFSGKTIFEYLVELATGVPSPDKEEKTPDGSVYVGKALKMEPGKDDVDNVHASHPALCEAIGIPVSSGGSLVLKTVFLKALAVLNEKRVASGQDKIVLE
jgi:hypothetical protein